MTKILTLIFITCIASSVWFVIKAIKGEIARWHHLDVIGAIMLYHMDLMKQGDFKPLANPVEFSDMEPLEDTIDRMWDWGYTRILPPEKMKIIKPYIKVYRR